jgi:pyrimidine deaminase RibD-like protein
VAKDGRVLGQARSDYKNEAVRACLENAGLEMTPLTEWCVQWPQKSDLRQDLLHSTLYVTLEPFQERRGTALPPTTQLIQQAGIPRVVIGSLNPVPSRAAKGAATLHNAGIEVSILPDPSSSNSTVKQACQRLIQGYAQLANSKLQRMARQQFRQFQQPLGFLHCSVVDSQNVDAYARHGNAFGTFFNGKQLGFRNVGAYDIAPPPEVIWADDEDDMNNNAMTMEGSAVGEGGNDDSGVWDVDFEDEDLQEALAKPNPMMPWYQQVDAVVATFPRPGHGPADDNSLTARLNGLRWLATHGNELPAGVERILVMDATDLIHLPLNNSNPHLPDGVNVESFWRADEKPRKPTRVLLRRGAHAQARAAAESAAASAKAAAIAAQLAVDAVESGNAEAAAEAAVECQQAATAANDYILSQLQKSQSIKSQLEEMGVLVETIQGGEPVDVMRHLGKRHGYHSVVWRAGCWGDRGVRAVLDGAFQWISAHLAVDAVGGRFWQLMLAENAVQAAVGPTSKCRIFCDQNDLSLEYCDNDAADDDCSMTIDGRPVRHIRLDCRVALVDPDRPRELVMAKTAVFNKVVEEEAPWFL